MLKLEKIIQLLLLAMLTQTGLLLMLHPMPHRLVFSQANLLFMVGLLGLLFCCAFILPENCRKSKVPCVSQAIIDTCFSCIF